MPYNLAQLQNYYNKPGPRFKPTIVLNESQFWRKFWKQAKQLPEHYQQLLEISAEPLWCRSKRVRPFDLFRPTFCRRFRQTWPLLRPSRALRWDRRARRTCRSPLLRTARHTLARHSLFRRKPVTNCHKNVTNVKMFVSLTKKAQILIDNIWLSNAKLKLSIGPQKQPLQPSRSGGVC